MPIAPFGGHHTASRPEKCVYFLSTPRISIPSLFCLKFHETLRKAVVEISLNPFQWEYGKNTVVRT
jgi:hypothetical protein